VTFKVADLLPVEVGLKYTAAVHWAPTASCVGRPLLCVNWPGLVPPRLMDVMGRTTLPVFFSVTTWPGVVVPTLTLPEIGRSQGVGRYRAGRDPGSTQGDSLHHGATSGGNRQGGRRRKESCRTCPPTAP